MGCGSSSAAADHGHGEEPERPDAAHRNADTQDHAEPSGEHGSADAGDVALSEGAVPDTVTHTHTQKRATSQQATEPLPPPPDASSAEAERAQPSGSASVPEQPAAQLPDALSAALTLAARPLSARVDTAAPLHVNLTALITALNIAATPEEIVAVLGDTYHVVRAVPAGRLPLSWVRSFSAAVDVSRGWPGREAAWTRDCLSALTAVRREMRARCPHTASASTLAMLSSQYGGFGGDAGDAGAQSGEQSVSVRSSKSDARDSSLAAIPEDGDSPVESAHTHTPAEPQPQGDRTPQRAVKARSGASRREVGTTN